MKPEGRLFSAAPRQTALPASLRAVMLAAALLIASVGLPAQTSTGGLLGGLPSNLPGSPSPAEAASSAQEVLNSDNSRPLAGATRYETAAKIAQSYFDTATQAGRAITSAIVVSGEGFADALSAAALAGYLEAPILLTPPGDLAQVVSSFITGNQIQTVFVVGGTAAVSASVATSLEALAGVTVTRLQGEDRYATALAVARQVAGRGGSSIGTYCATGDRTALLATGEGFADALAGGPLAYDGLLPVLLTPKDELPDGILEYLNEMAVDRVVILGGTAAVSNDIQRQISSAGIAITRLAGANRFATAVAVTDALTIGPDGCGWLADNFGFTNGRKPFDSLAGSPLLGLRRDPLLLTEPDELAPATSDYLASTPDQRDDGQAAAVALYVLGGTATVGPEVVADAIDAALGLAEPGAPIEATVVGYPNEFRFVVNFSEAVDTTTAEQRSSYLLDGEPLKSKFTLTYYPPDPAADNPLAHVLVDLCCERLEAGAVITVQPNTIRASRAASRRFVAGVTYTVPDTRPPPS